MGTGTWKAAVVFAATLLISWGARADTPKGPPPGYNETLLQALRYVDTEQWPEALALFEKAHVMYPNARTQRGLAIVSFASRRYVETLGHAQAAIDNRVRPLTDKQRQHLEGLIDQAKTFVGRFEVVLTPKDAQLLVNGRLARIDAGKTLLDPGKYELVGRAAGHTDVVRQLVVHTGQEGRLELRLPRAPNEPTEAGQREPGDVARTRGAPGEVPAAQARAAPAEALAADATAHSPRVWTWVAGGVAVAAAGVALGSFISANAERDDIADTCRAKPSGRCELDERDRLLEDSGISTKETISTVGLVVSLTAAATAGFLFWFEPRTDASDTGIALGVSPGALSVAGTF